MTLKYKVARLIPAVVPGKHLTVEECECLLLANGRNDSRVTKQDVETVADTLTQKRGMALFPLNSTISCLRMLGSRAPLPPMTRLLQILRDYDHYKMLSESSTATLVKMAALHTKSIPDVKRLLLASPDPDAPPTIPKFEKLMGIKPTQRATTTSLLDRLKQAAVPDKTLLILLRVCRLKDADAEELLSAAASILLDRNPDKHATNITMFLDVNVTPLIVQKVASFKVFDPPASNLLNFLMWLSSRLQREIYGDMIRLLRRFSITQSTNVMKIEKLWPHLVRHRLERHLNLTIEVSNKLAVSKKRNRSNPPPTTSLCTPVMLSAYVKGRDRCPKPLLQKLVTLTGLFIVSQNRNLKIESGEVLLTIIQHLSQMNDHRLVFEIVSVAVLRIASLRSVLQPRTSLFVIHNLLKYLKASEIPPARVSELVHRIVESCCIDESVSDVGFRLNVFLHGSHKRPICLELHELKTRTAVVTRGHADLLPFKALLIIDILDGYRVCGANRSTLPGIHFDELLRIACHEYLETNMNHTTLVRILYKLALLKGSSKSKYAPPMMAYLLKRMPLNSVDISTLVWSFTMLSVDSKNALNALTTKLDGMDMDSFTDSQFMRILWSYSKLVESVGKPEVTQRLKARTLKVDVTPNMIDGIVAAFDRMTLQQTELQKVFERKLAQRSSATPVHLPPSRTSKNTKLDQLVSRLAEKRNSSSSRKRRPHREKLP
eukprot:TRINITY_DN31325_c0_g1_i1.p1 TRINITY_DN31325_c0_g1~~TRINITY_DN31325_c0_g1_i1.p1  ORF type:complete len:717 (+),score=79.56 TRINITY_DN31325_c0_g1_i1:61-2211(+)